MFHVARHDGVVPEEEQQFYRGILVFSRYDKTTGFGIASLRSSESFCRLTWFIVLSLLASNMRY